MDSLFIGLIVLALLSLCTSVVAAVILWRSRYGEHAELIKKRIESVSAKRSSNNIQPVSKNQLSSLKSIDSLLQRLSFVVWLDTQLLKTGRFFHVDQVLGGWILTESVVIISLIRLDVPFYFGLIICLSLILLPVILVKAMIQRRRNQFEKQLPDVLDFISRAMQAGHAFSSALQVAAIESPEPIRHEFLQTINEINFGVPIYQALTDLSGRIDSSDMRFFAIAVMINRDVGGDLAGLLNNLSALIRERIGMRASIHALTAEGRFSAWILSLLPFFVGLLLYIIRPDFIEVLWKDPAGRNMLAWAGCLMMVGVLWMRRIANIRI
ncbi:MAG: type II secretion system F family protein [Sheuella sp.]|nr:type II secretion system F family protein [Sheuella sp.]